MAYEDTLFQLGMDLTRSSTAQKEDYDGTARVVHDNDQQEDRKDFFIERDGVRYAGNHLIIDLFGASHLDDIDHVKHTLEKCVEEAGASLLHIHLHHFTPNDGISGVAVLAESHISVHTWPERNYAAFDFFMCGQAEPERAVQVIERAFGPARSELRTLLRGAQGSTRGE